MWGRGNAREARKRGCADERSVRDSASALMLCPPSPAVSRFQREHGGGGLRGGARSKDKSLASVEKELRFKVEASILEGGARGIPKMLMLSMLKEKKDDLVEEFFENLHMKVACAIAKATQELRKWQQTEVNEEEMKVVKKEEFDALIRPKIKTLDEAMSCTSPHSSATTASSTINLTSPCIPFNSTTAFTISDTFSIIASSPPAPSQTQATSENVNMDLTLSPATAAPIVMVQEPTPRSNTTLANLSHALAQLQVPPPTMTSAWLATPTEPLCQSSCSMSRTPVPDDSKAAKQKATGGAVTNTKHLKK
ncbi:hypothetical protein BDN71DRAFT_1428303 [Pleurotus eryngii]|uniref:Uncharacterized protein n=1 Tax=Pleurotus eryngii TaxID=5323 RepID=A0A9P6A7S3_PLEER|nr:hypothetical protein BDN71DRAFT_1428303 [Pleurotus eryngii]